MEGVNDEIKQRIDVALIILPAAFATTFTFTAYVEECKIGDFPINGKVPFSASLNITGKPVLALTAEVNQIAIDANDRRAALANRMSGWFVAVVLLLAMVTFLIWLPRGVPSRSVTMRSISWYIGVSTMPGL